MRLGQPDGLPSPASLPFGHLSRSVVAGEGPGPVSFQTGPYTLTLTSATTATTRRKSERRWYTVAPFEQSRRAADQLRGRFRGTWPKLTISYRRADSESITGRIFDRLAERYGKDSVFRDVDNIPFGIDFRDHIDEALSRSDILIVVVGRKWIGRNERIKEDADPVRIEVETAMRLHLRVIPVLVEGARMPKAEQLPESLKRYGIK